MNGEDVVKAFEVVEEVWRETGLMADRLAGFLKDAVGNLKEKQGWLCANEYRSYETFDESEAVKAKAYTLGIKVRKNGHPIKYVGFQVAFGSDMIDIPGVSRSPIIYMIVSKDKWGLNGDDEDWYIGFPLDCELELNGGVLLELDDDSDTKCYAVSLMELHNEEDLKNLCVDPIIKLAIANSTINIKDIFPCHGDEVDTRIIRFPVKEKLVGGID